MSLRQVDPLVATEIISFLNPLEVVKMECTNKEWFERIRNVWCILRKMPYLRHLTFKKHSVLTDKALCIQAWRAITSCRGIIYQIGGLTPVDFNGNSISVSTFAFNDNTTQFFPYVFRSTPLYQEFLQELSASATVVDSSGNVRTFGGWNCNEEESTDQCYVHDPLTGWLPFTRMKNKACFLAATCNIDGDILVSGGGSSLFQGSSVAAESYLLRHSSGSSRCAVSDSLEVNDYTLSNFAWINMPQMNNPRCGHGAVTTLSGRSYSIGGYGGGSIYHSSGEYFDYESMKWVDIAPMNHNRSGLGVDMSSQGAVYAVGGSPNGLAGHNSVEMFDERVGKWQEVSHMLRRRGFVGACFGASGILYAAGGMDNEMFIASVEWMDPRMNKWNYLCDEENIIFPFLERADYQMVYVMGHFY